MRVFGLSYLFLLACSWPALSFAQVTCAPTSCVPACESSCTYQACDGVASVQVSMTQLPVPYTMPYNACADSFPQPFAQLPTTVSGNNVTLIPQTITHNYNVCATHVSVGGACPVIPDPPQPQPPGPQPPGPQPPNPQPPGGGRWQQTGFRSLNNLQPPCSFSFNTLPSPSCPTVGEECYNASGNILGGYFWYQHRCVASAPNPFQPPPSNSGRWRNTGEVTSFGGTPYCPFPGTTASGVSCPTVGSQCWGIAGSAITTLTSVRFVCE